MSAPVTGVSGGQGIRRRHGRAEHSSSENDHQISAGKDGHRMSSRDFAESRSRHGGGRHDRQ